MVKVALEKPIDIDSFSSFHMGAHCPTMEKLSVLVLDDNPTSLLIISNMLAKFNFKVLPFQTAEEALDSLKKGAAKEEEFDLILAEVCVNTATGNLANSELLHHIQNELRVPIITMCAYDDEEAVSECISLGACFHVVKPLNTESHNILKQKALQHRSRRAKLVGSGILNKAKSRTDSSSTNKPKRMAILEGNDVCESESEENEDPDVWKARDYSKKPGRLTWSIELHEMFLEAVVFLGKKRAVPGRILRLMNVKDLTAKQVASHLQKHRLRELKAYQVGQDQQNAGMEPVSELISLAYNAAASESIDQLKTTRMPMKPRIATAVRKKCPTRLQTRVEKRPQPTEPAAPKTCTGTSAICGDDTKSIWDKYWQRLQLAGGSRRSSKRQLSSSSDQLPVRKKAIISDEGVANEALNAGREMGYAAPASASLESSGSSNLFTSEPVLVGENNRTEAAGNNDNLENNADALLEDISNKGYTVATDPSDGWGDLESNSLLEDTNKNSTADMEPSGPCDDWEELKAFWMSQLEGSQEQQDFRPNDLLQVDNAWSDALRSASLTNIDALMVQGATIGDAPGYDPVQQFAEGDTCWSWSCWSPQVLGDYGMQL